ncbi:MAG TPA: TIGR01777 family oxidoreductase [Kofleriaceae bacterium]|nr:TIGR01777 family oxidoreductase [Kofleriaceae bacterium]
MKIVVTGATGFIGRALVSELVEQGHHVVAFTRGKRLERVENVEVQTLESQGPWCDALAGADAIAHLAGAPVNGTKWDARGKQLIRDSRVESTRTIVEALTKLTPASARPHTLITASGVDYYPFAYDETDFDDDEVTESDKPGDTFLARVCRDWEREALNAAAAPLNLRVACMRTGLVLGKGGGALPELARPFKFFAGGPVGDGRQWVSWIHLDDVVAAYIAALTDDRYRGPINMVTASIRNRDFASALGHAMSRPAFLPVPKFAVKLVAGKEFAESILKGRRVMPTKLRELGFAWKYPTLERALAAAV